MSQQEFVQDWEYWLKKYIQLVGTNPNFWRGHYYEELFREVFLKNSPRWDIEFVTLTSPVLHFHEIQSCYETDVIPINKSKMILLMRLAQQRNFKSWLHVYQHLKDKWFTVEVANLIGKEVGIDSVIRTAKFGQGKPRKRYLLPFQFFQPTNPIGQGWYYTKQSEASPK